MNPIQRLRQGLKTLRIRFFDPFMPRQLALAVRQKVIDGAEVVGNFAGRIRAGFSTVASEGEPEPIAATAPTVLAPTIAATVVDLREFGDRNCVTPVRHQGDSGWCAYFALVAAAESRALAEHPHLPAELDLSEGELAARGGKETHTAAMEAAGRGGLVEETDFDGAGRVVASREWRVAFAPITGSTRRKQERMMAALRRGQPLLSVLSPDADFFCDHVPLPYRRRESRFRHHAVCIMGFMEHHGQSYWIFKNSYGTEWGDAGFGTVPFGDACGPELDVMVLTSVIPPI